MNEVSSVSTRYPMYVLTGVLGLVTVAIVGYGFHKGNRIAASHAPLTHAAMEIKLEATTAHLWLEELLSGHGSGTIESVWESLDRAAWCARAMLEGAKDAEGTLVPLDDARLRREIREVEEKLASFREVTRERLQARALSHGGTDVVQRYHAMVEDLTFQADEVETELQKVMAQDLQRFRATQALLIVTTVLLSSVVIAAFRRFEHREARVFGEILRARQSLEDEIGERRRAEDIMRSQRKLGLALSSTTSLDEGLRLCMEAALRVSDLDCGGIYLFDETFTALDIKFQTGLPRRFIESASHYEADSVNARLVTAGQPIYTRHQEMGLLLNEAKLREGLRAIAIIPLRHEEKVIGCLNVASHRFDEVPGYCRVALEAIAAQIGNAIVHLKTEEALARNRDHLEELVRERTRELEVAHEELLRKERLATLGQLTATVSHELRNPLGTIRSSIFTIGELTRDRGLGIEHVLDRVERSIVRCDNMIEELLDYTRTRPLACARTSVDEWLGQVLSELEIPGGIALEPELSSGVEVAIDRERFRRCLVNVVDNACQAMLEAKRPAGHLTLRTEVLGDRLEVRIIDTGVGVAPEHLDRLFEPLFSTKGFGVGLGLPLARQIMEQQGGGIDIHSKPDEGTEVTLWLPILGNENGRCV